MNSENASSSGMHTGSLIVNSDDWGRDRENTDRILDCILQGSVSSTSAMVFMEDSERSAALARENGVDAGLHLNLTSEFSAPQTSSQLKEQQQKIAGYLRRHRFAPIVFHPGLSSSFEYVVKAQLDEFQRLYGSGPERIDGHHHMHLSANVVFGKLLPANTIVRRNFTFRRGEKGFFNRIYRQFIDQRLQRRHDLSDFMFDVRPFTSTDRLRQICSLAKQFSVEVETHPIRPDEYQFLMEGEMFRVAGDVPIASRFVLPKRDKHLKTDQDTNLSDKATHSLACAFAIGVTVLPVIDRLI